MNKATLRPKLLDDLNVTLRFIRKLYEADSTMATPFAMADGTESTCSKVNDPNSTMVCVADTNRYLPSVFGFYDDS